ncbi:MAG: DUF1761 domain-containing protein [Saprospiraceae bacterium]|nr:DUF1761 domain-containing protein [Saprospiraceae bacterium]
MEYINWLGVLLASICSFILGWLWYSPMLFGKSWMEDNQLDKEKLMQSNFIKVFGLSFIMTCIYAFMLAKTILRTDLSGMADGLKFGLMAGAFFSAMSLGISYQFSHRTTRLYFIDAGYMVVSSTIMGAIIGWMG